MNSGTRLFLVVTHPLVDKLTIVIVLASSNLSFQFIADFEEDLDEPRESQKQLHNRGNHRSLGAVDMQAQMLQDSDNLFEDRVILRRRRELHDDTGGNHDAAENCDDIFCVGDHKRNNLSHVVTYTQTQPQGQRSKSEKPGVLTPGFCYLLMSWWIRSRTKSNRHRRT